jgi:cytochrome c peroxidase
MSFRRAAPSVLFIAVAACASETSSSGTEPEPYDGPPIPWAYAPFPSVVEPVDNPTTDEKIALGTLLFYDPILSRDQKTACATCHSEVWGMSDGLAVSIGVDGDGPTGPGREGPNMTTRNAPTIWNVAFKDALFWDGRSESLEAQALEPLKAEKELDLDPAAAAQAIASVPEYAAMFEDAYPGEGVTPDNLAKTLAAFERSVLSIRAPYDRYTEGDVGALSDASKQGMQLFADGGCDTCHAPPLFESARYVARLDVGADLGREDVTEDAADRGAFRVPTLRNIRESGPYFHDGSAPDLRAAVRKEADTSAARGEGRTLTDEEVDLVVTFLNKGLTDRTKEPPRPHSVPSGLEIPEDGFRVPR